LKEFILYWKENGTALRSWNSKFVDFVKRKELIGSYEEKNDKKTNRHNEPGEFTQQFKERTKDDSGQKISNSERKSFIEAIDNLFLKLELSYHYQFYKVFGTDHRLTEAKKLWAESLKNIQLNA